MSEAVPAAGEGPDFQSYRELFNRKYGGGIRWFYDLGARVKGQSFACGDTAIGIFDTAFSASTDKCMFLGCVEVDSFSPTLRASIEATYGRLTYVAILRILPEIINSVFFRLVDMIIKTGVIYTKLE